MHAGLVGADEEIGANGKRIKRKKSTGKRKLRGLADRRGPKTLARLLEEV